MGQDVVRPRRRHLLHAARAPSLVRIEADRDVAGRRAVAKRPARRAEVEEPPSAVRAFVRTRELPHAISLVGFGAPAPVPGMPRLRPALALLPFLRTLLFEENPGRRRGLAERLRIDPPVRAAAVDNAEHPLEAGDVGVLGGQLPPQGEDGLIPSVELSQQPELLRIGDESGGVWMCAFRPLTPACAGTRCTSSRPRREASRPRGRSRRPPGPASGSAAEHASS